MAKQELKIRRVVTGHDAQGRSIIEQDGDSPLVHSVFHENFILNTLWRQESLPADNAGPFEEVCTSMEQVVSLGGNMLRIVQWPPEKDFIDNVPKKIKMGNVLMGEDSDRHPMMHRTQSLDYIIVLKGEIHAIMDVGETVLKTGDVLIQRGTVHAWSNRSDDVCILLSITNGALPLNKA